MDPNAGCLVEGSRLANRKTQVHDHGCSGAEIWEMRPAGLVDDNVAFVLPVP